LIGVTDGVGRGSARSADGINIFKLLAACRDLFLDFGGHEGAAGFEIEEAKIPKLMERLKVKVDELISPEKLIPRLEIDAELDPKRITLSLIKELELLDPHGEGNPAPVFLSRGLTLTDLRKVGAKGKHLKLKLTDGRVNLEAIGFSLGDLAEKLTYNKNYDIAYELEANEWNGFESAQLSLIDIKETKQ
jgi:single-stranded-DNA-specific exonuclease